MKDDALGLPPSGPEPALLGGLNARAMRLRRRLTLDQLATAANLSKGHLSRFERGEKALSVAALMRLARALGTSTSSLLGETIDEDAVRLVRRSERRMMRAPPEEGGYAFALLNRSDEGSELDLFMLELSADASMTRGVTHAGQESFLVLDGEVEMQVGDQVYSLKKGDYLEFAGNLRHRVSTKSHKASVLVVVARQ